MLACGEGILLFTTGVSAIVPYPSCTWAGVRAYALNLNAELRDQGVYAAHVCIGRVIQSGTAADPDLLAEVYFGLYQRRDRSEHLVAFSEAQ